MRESARVWVSLAFGRTRAGSVETTQEKAFNTLKLRLTTAPVLAPPQEGLKYRLTPDASAFGIGSTLEQLHPEGWRPVAFYSRKLNNAERNYTVTERELLAVVDSLRQFSYLLEGGPQFFVRTDHRPLVWLPNQPKLSPRQMRWLELIRNFDFTIGYIERITVRLPHASVIPENYIFIMTCCGRVASRHQP